MLCFVSAIVKCTSTYFSRAKDAGCFFVHSEQCLWMLCSVLQLSSIILQKARAFMSLTKQISNYGEVGGMACIGKIGVVIQGKDQ